LRPLENKWAFLSSHLRKTKARAHIGQSRTREIMRYSKNVLVGMMTSPFRNCVLDDSILIFVFSWGNTTKGVF
jgi:hypothetical protein